jgi:integrase
MEDYRWSLTHHLLPFFAEHRLSEITVREVDRYRAAKMAEGVLGANQVNKTLTRLTQILEVAAEYGLIPANPAAGRRRRVKSTRPSRPVVEPEQLMALLEAGSGRPLLAVLAGAGLRIGEALGLRWGDVDLAVGTLRVVKSKTDAGVRVVDLTPALREELAKHKADARFDGPDDYVFATATGRAKNRHNERRAVLLPAIKAANERLERLGIAPIGPATFHSLRRTFASIRAALGDDPAYIAEQIGHEDATFSLNVYAKAVKRRARLTGTHLEAFDRALEWAQTGTNGALTVPAVSLTGNAETANPA